MNTPKKSECTEEEWAFLRWQSAAEKGIHTHLSKAVTLAIQRHGRDYGQQYVDGVLRRIWADHPKPERAKKPYTKIVIPRKLAIQVFERDGYRCVKCGDWHDLCADHIIPERHGGLATIENLQTLCRLCNCRKGTRI